MDLEQLDPARSVDATGLSCPLPVLELARAIDDVAIGELVLLAATDPAAGLDVPVWCRMRRQRLVHREERDGVWRFVVERAN
ncbi:MAG: sulfurtransferase TusA family protein [Nitriliruptoraceae bacterium]|nr:sulfurtransferase TusA family protein [Nitriliruptoraceae bacterium]